METQPPPTKVPKLSEDEEQEKVVKLLEKRLEKHDENRKAAQDKLKGLQDKVTGQVVKLEERINKELEKKFTLENNRLQRIINKLRGDNSDNVLQKAKAELLVEQSYEIIENKGSKPSITTLYKLKTERRAVLESGPDELAISEVDASVPVPPDTKEEGNITCNPDKLDEEREKVIKLLEKHLEKHDENRKAAQDKLHEVCEGLRAQIDELEERVNKELEEEFTPEDNRLQKILNKLRGNNTPSILQKAKAELLVEQSYEIIDNKEAKHDLTTLHKLKAERRIVSELMEVRKPSNVRVTGVDRGRSVSVDFTCLNPDEERVLSDCTIANPVEYECMLFKKGEEQEGKEYPLNKNEEDGDSSSSSFSFTSDIICAETTYCVRVKMVVDDDRESEWSDEIAEFTTPEFKECCMWEECPDYVDDNNIYSVDGDNPRIATMNGNGWCTIIGNTHIPPNKVISWNIKILKSRDNDGGAINIGIAPNDINQNVFNYDKCGWYLNCYNSTLRSGPPHNYNYEEYGPRKENYGEYVHTGDSVGVIMDATKGDLSFVLNGVNRGVAYEGIPLDKPLVPCVILHYKGDSVELTF